MVIVPIRLIPGDRYVAKPLTVNDGTKRLLIACLTPQSASASLFCVLRNVGLFSRASSIAPSNVRRTDSCPSAIATVVKSAAAVRVKALFACPAPRSDSRVILDLIRVILDLICIILDLICIILDLIRVILDLR